MRIKEKYSTIKHNGVLYNLGGYSEEKLRMIYDANPQLRFAFEEEDKFEKKSIKDLPKFDEGLIDLGIDTAEKFEAEIKKVAKAPAKKKK